MDCEYFISGQARKVNVSLVSWKNETRTGDRRENKIGVLDNRPLNTLVSWKEGENGKFDRVHFFTLFRVSPESRRVLLVPSDFITSMKDISDVINHLFL